MADTERDLTIETADAAPIDAAKGAEIMEKFEKEDKKIRNKKLQRLHFRLQTWVTKNMVL